MSQNTINEVGIHDIATAETNAESLITEHLDLWTSAITTKVTTGRGSSKKYELYGIKKLRELILELAVRGKLVAQDPDDDAASDLLKRIGEKKASLCKEGKISKNKQFPEITEEEKPFSLPRNWSYIRLGEITSKLGSGCTPRGGKRAYVESGIPFLRSQNVWSQGLRLDDIAYISLETHKKMENTRVFPGDILLNITGASLGRSTIFPASLGEANVSQHVTIIRLVEPVMAPFVHLGILSPMIQHLVWGRQVGMAIEGLSKKVLENFEFPIPPLAEQQRIVAKVDELMALCDQLENQTEQSLNAHATLVDTLLDALTRAQSAEELADNWQRLEENWDTLLPDTLAGERAIDKLKLTILQLAVMGKLVPPDPDDEPAGELLKRISTEKEQLVKDKIIKKPKPLPSIDDEEKRFELPQEWEYVRLGECIQLISGQHLKPEEYSNYESPESVPYITGPAEFGARFPTWSKYTDQKRALAERGDILITCKGSGIGKLNQSSEQIAISRQLMAIRPMGISTEFLYLFLQAKYDYFQDKGVGIAIPGISRDDIESLVVALPGAAVQIRLVSKVNELIACCDQLQYRLQQVQKIKAYTADAISQTGIGEYRNPIHIQVEDAAVMKIVTDLTLGSVAPDQSSIIAPLLDKEEGTADAKVIWNKTKLPLPEFYMQLKKEIEAGFISKPPQASVEV